VAGGSKAGGETTGIIFVGGGKPTVSIDKDVYGWDVEVGRTPPWGGGEAGKELLFGGIPGGARSALPESVGAGTPAGEDGSAVGEGSTPPGGGGETGKELLFGGRGIPEGARSGGEDGSAVGGGGGTPPEGAGKASEGLSGEPSGCANAMSATVARTYMV
jgi:hypothetical protein